MASGRVDVGLCNEASEGNGIAVELSLRLPCRTAIPVGHPLAEKSEIEPADLDGEAFISLGDEFYARFLDDPDTLARLVAMGCGIGLLDPLTADFVETVDIVTRPFVPVVNYPISIVTSTARAPSRMADRLVEELAAMLSKRADAQ